MKLALNSFIGEFPKLAPRLLDQRAAQKAEEVNFLSGELRPFYADTPVLNLENTITDVYKWNVSTSKHAWILSTSKFIVEKSPVFNDEYNKIVINYPLSKKTRITDTSKVSLSIGADSNYLPVTLTNSNTYTLEVPKVVSATMSVDGTSSSNTESRSYAIALVRKWGDGKLDIGPLYAPVKTATGSLTVDVGSGQTVKINNITLPAGCYSDSGVRLIYVYRSTVGSDGTSMYGYVGSIDVQNDTQTTFNFVDNIKAEDVGEAAVSSEWDTPPAFSGIASLSNGVFVGYDGYDVYFSYPHQIHAWPYTYRVTVDYEIVGVGSFGNTVVVCTKGCPYLLLVEDPAIITTKVINTPCPCLSRESIVSTRNGVIYASTNGLVLINSTAPTYFTEGVFTKREWKDFNPEYLKGGCYLDNYVGVSYANGISTGFIINLSNPALGISRFSRNLRFVYSDPSDNLLYFIIVDSGKRKLVSFDNATTYSDQAHNPFTWRSKIFTSNQGIINLATCRIRADYNIILSSGDDVDIEEYIDENRPINSTPLNAYVLNSPINSSFILERIDDESSVTFTYYVNGENKFSKKLYSSAPFRLPSGFVGDEVEVEISARIPVHSIELASSMGELM